MTILAAVDENERSKKVIEVAHDLATRYDDTLAVLHVIPTDEFNDHTKAIREIPEFQDFSMSDEVEGAERFARKFALETIPDLDTSMLDPRGRVGEIADEIVAEAGQEDPRFLVISGRRRSPTGKALFGNTTQQILLNVDCPVVTQMEQF
ncbi:universal stress protein [Halobellus salinisoli]|uniref:universal stress protein n=1 Tax=Halobellus salinisoli TaxID=3108500 RepID=UPI00300B21EB